MAWFSSQAPQMSYTLRALAHLLRYPGAELRAHLGELSAALRAERALSDSRLDELDALMQQIGGNDALRTESGYVDLFDRGRSTSLHLFEHVHGDSRDRGPAMVDLTRTYEEAGLLLAPDELPDHLGVVLEFASTRPPQQAREFIGETAHIVRAVFSALLARRTPYASVLAAVLDLAGEKAEAVAFEPDAAVDDSWAEPAAFDGCSNAGQARAGQPQPIRIIRPSQQPGAQR